MPLLKEHEEQSIKRYGKPFTELHQWMDEAVKVMGRGHRKYRHDPNITPIEAKRMFGENADNACLDHIILDTEEFIENKKLKNTKSTEYSQQVSIRIPNEIMRNIFDYAKDCNKNNLTQTILTFIRRGAISMNLIEKTKKFLDEQEQLMENLIITDISRANMETPNPYLRTLERDNCTCRKCGHSTPDVLPMELSLDFNDMRPAGFSIESRITLCKKCREDFKNYILSNLTLEQFIEWYYSKTND
jgi:hypothetical protein